MNFGEIYVKFHENRVKIRVKFHEKCDRKLKSITFYMKFT